MASFQFEEIKDKPRQRFLRVIRRFLHDKLPSLAILFNIFADFNAIASIFSPLQTFISG